MAKNEVLATDHTSHLQTFWVVANGRKHICQICQNYNSSITWKQGERETINEIRWIFASSLIPLPPWRFLCEIRNKFLNESLNCSELLGKQRIAKLVSQPICSRCQFLHTTNEMLRNATTKPFRIVAHTHTWTLNINLPIVAWLRIAHLKSRTFVAIRS